TPMSHALATAIGTYVVAESGFGVVRLVRGTAVPWGAIAFTLSAVALAGLIGGFLGSRLQTSGARPSMRR
ncbi:MAG: hypothetical protein AAFP84_14260, partial [Actinomycetota bacterium]